MGRQLVERDAELAFFDDVLAGAPERRGATVLLAGEAGVGKTALVRAVLARASGRARVLTGRCDDLLSARPLGPVRDIASGTGGAVLAAVEAGDRGALFDTVLRELAAAPTVVVVEDVHWADEATVDVLWFLCRRIADLPVVLVLTYRDGEIGAQDPIARLLGVLTGEGVHRVRLSALSVDGVANLAGGAVADPAALHELTGGNPFFVTEVLAGDGEVPATVVDAVLARTGALPAPAREALEQLCVVPSGLEIPLARALLGDLGVLADAERRGMLDLRATTVAFRHELARRAVEGALPESRRIVLDERVVQVLLAVDPPDLARVVHHAVRARDDVAVARHAPEAARRACRAGAQTQGAALYEQALRVAHLLDGESHADLAHAYSWALFHSNRVTEAIAAAEEAVRLHADGEPGPLARALAGLSVQLWSDLRTGPALAAAERAVRTVRGAPDSPGAVFAHTHLGTLLVNIDREREALVPLDDAAAMAVRIDGRPDPVSMIFRGRARLMTGDDGGLAEAERGLELARARGNHEAVMMFYLNTVSALWQVGRYTEVERLLAERVADGRTRDSPFFDQSCHTYSLRLLTLRGQWDDAERGWRDLLARSGPDSSIGRRYVVPRLAALAVRRGRPDAGSLLAAARRTADDAANLQIATTTRVAELESAWLDDRIDRELVDAAHDLVARTDRPGHERDRGELLRWLRRLGEPVEPFPGCPEEFAAGIRGDRRAAAVAWERRDAPYERALELTDADDPDAQLEGLAILDRLEAGPASRRVRHRMRAAGAATVPRGPQRRTRTHPAGLTARQAEILRLLALGHTNAEIATRLVLSVRTVDHHVSAVLRKLNAADRREAAEIAVRLVRAR